MRPLGDYCQNGFVVTHAFELPQSYRGDTRRAHCFYDYIYITYILLLYDLSTMCGLDHDHMYIYIYNIYDNIHIIYVNI